MNILLVGGAGFIGSNLIYSLVSRGDCQISVLEPEFASLQRLEGMPVNIYRGELSNLDKLETIIIKQKISVVVHLVSTIIPGSDFDDYQREFTNVIFPSIRLMELCSERGIKFVYFSSGGTIYGDRKGDVVPFKEECPMAPISYYGWSKQMMENSILYMHRTQGLRYLILRPSNPFGIGQNLYGKQGLIAVAIGKILAGEKITIWGDGSAVRDYIYIDDLSQALVDILENDNIINTTLNIGSGVGYSINQIIDIIRKVVDENVLVEYVEARKVDVSSVILDITKVRNLICFNPQSIEVGISKFYRSIKNGK